MSAPAPPSSAIATLPNLVSAIRLLLIPVFLWLLLGVDQVAAAGWLLLFIGATDWVDGYLARRLGQVSEIGTMLDPVADRLAVVAAVIGGLVAGVLPAWFVWALLVREVVLAGVAIYLSVRLGRRLEVRWLGKAATLVLYAAIAAWFVGVGTPIGWLEVLAGLGGAVGIALYYLVMVMYLVDARRLVAAAGDDEGPVGTLPHGPAEDE